MVKLISRTKTTNWPYTLLFRYYHSKRRSDHITVMLLNTFTSEEETEIDFENVCIQQTCLFRNLFCLITELRTKFFLKEGNPRTVKFRNWKHFKFYKSNLDKDEMVHYKYFLKKNLFNGHWWMKVYRTMVLWKMYTNFVMYFYNLLIKMSVFFVDMFWCTKLKSL